MTLIVELNYFHAVLFHIYVPIPQSYLAQAIKRRDTIWKLSKQEKLLLF